MTSPRPLHVIAREIRSDFRGQKLWPFAEPFVSAMLSMDSITDNYSASVVRDALSSLTTWRGETARRVKAELKGMLKS